MMDGACTALFIIILVAEPVCVVCRSGGAAVMSRELRCDVGAIRITADLHSLHPRGLSADLQIDSMQSRQPLEHFTSK